tara:strand:- start:35 stop:553 length:519 start_codon:yes stop_codon:yes gene_type:complete
MTDETALQQALGQLAATPSALAHLTVETMESVLDIAPEGEWSGRVVLAHFRDAEVLEFRLGLERLLAEENPALFFLPPDEWEQKRNRERDQKGVLLGDFALQRQASLNLIASVQTNDWERQGAGPGGTLFTIAQLVQVWAEHDAAHLSQLEVLLSDTVTSAQGRRARSPEGP